jgi:hypothetical protein
VVIPLALLLASGIGLASDPAPTDQLAGGCLQGSGAPRQSQVESYPATTFTPVEDGPEKLALDSVIAAPYRTGVVVTQEQLRHYSWRWWRSGPHPFLDSLLPGTQFYRVREHGTAVDDPGRDDNVALYRGKLYHLTQLNALLADAGFILDSAQAPAAAKAAVLFTLMGSEQKTGVIGVLPDFGVSRLAVPAVEFYSVRVGRWPHPRRQGPTPGVLVDCSVGGHRRVMFVEFQPTYGGGWQLEEVSDTLGGAPRMHFRGVWPPPERPRARN